MIDTLVESFFEYKARKDYLKTLPSTVIIAEDKKLLLLSENIRTALIAESKKSKNKKK